MVIKNKVFLVISAAIFALLHILWEYFNGGVVTHYPLADASNPGISNWWGLLSFPALTWAALAVIEKGNGATKNEGVSTGNIVLRPQYFLGGLAFGLMASLLWELGQEGLLQYVMLLPWILSFFLRIYLPETTLGFVLGMTYTFGGVLPIVFALVIQTVGFVINLVIYRGGRWLLRRFA